MVDGASAERPRILFLTRTYPPVRGGMEQYCKDLYSNLAKLEDVTLVANEGGKRNLLFFLFRAVFYLIGNARRYTHVHLGDAVLSPLLFLVRLSSRAQVSVTVYGLDVVYPNWAYQKLVPFCLRRMDRIVGISRATLDECRRRGIAEKRLVLIPAGVDFSTLGASEMTLEDLEARFGKALKGRRLLFSIARLVERKGHAWFVSNVMFRLGPEYVYLIAGEGPERGSIERCIAEGGLQERVFLLGAVTDEEKRALLTHAELFLMPNRHVEGDLEGFGLTMVEAAALGTPSVAAKVDGIVDAIVEGETGFLVPEADVQVFVARIQSCTLERDRVRQSAEGNYSWSSAARRYASIFAS